MGRIRVWNTRTDMTWHEIFISTLILCRCLAQITQLTLYVCVSQIKRYSWQLVHFVGVGWYLCRVHTSNKRLSSFMCRCLTHSGTERHVRAGWVPAGWRRISPGTASEVRISTGWCLYGFTHFLARWILRWYFNIGYGRLVPNSHLLAICGDQKVSIHGRRMQGVRCDVISPRSVRCSLAVPWLEA